MGEAPNSQLSGGSPEVGHLCRWRETGVEILVIGGVDWRTQGASFQQGQPNSALAALYLITWLVSLEITIYTVYMSYNLDVVETRRC
jgi:hypothetical protein